MFVTVRENAFGKGCELKLCKETFSEVRQGKPRVAVASDQANLYMVPRVGS